MADYELVDAPEPAFDLVDAPEPKQPEVPPAFLERLQRGNALGRVLSSVAEGAVEGFGSGPLGFEHDSKATQFLQEVGVFSGPNKGITPLRLFNEATLKPAAIALDTLFRGFNAGAFAVGGLAGGLLEEGGASSGDVNRAKRDVSQIVNFAGLLSGAEVTRVRPGKIGSVAMEETVGRLPEAGDFVTAERAATGGTPEPHVAAKLDKLWREDGVHPAEVIADMKDDPMLAAQVLAKGEQIPAHYRAPEADAGGKPPTEPPKGGDLISTGGEKLPDIPVEPLMPGETLGLEQAQRLILDRLSVGEKPEGQGITWNRFYTWTVDKFNPIQKAVEEAGRGLNTADDPYRLARLYMGWAGKADVFINSGPRDFHTYAKVGDSLTSIMAPVKTDMDGFRAFAAAARAAELENRGIATGINMDAARVVVEQGKGTYGPVMLKLVDYQNNVAKYLRDSGVLSRAGYDALAEANKLFIPFHRLMDMEGKRIQGTGETLQAQNPVHKIKGSERVIIDPIESVIKNTYLLTSMAEKNAVGTKLVDMLFDADRKPTGSDVTVVKTEAQVPDVARQMFQDMDITNRDLQQTLHVATQELREGEIRVFRDGRAETYRVDGDLAAAVKNLDAATVGLMEKLLAPLANTMRAGAMLNPEFAIRHTIREPFTALLTFTKGVFSPVDTLRGMVSYISKDKHFDDWMMGGGGHSSLVALDRNYLQISLEQLTEQTGIMSRAWNVMIDPQSTMYSKGAAALGVPVEGFGKYVVHPLQVMTETVTSATKLGAYRKAIQYAEMPEGKSAIQDAAWVSRETGQDNARMGAKMKGLNMISAFLNARVQDVDSMVRAAKNDPGGFSVKTGAAITAPSLLLWWANKDDSRYQNLPDWQKDLFWIVPTDDWVPATEQDVAGLPIDQIRKADGKLERNNGVIYRIPKPFTMGIVFGSGAERLADAYFKENKHAFDRFGNTIKEAVVGSVIPTALTPMLEQAMNKSALSGSAVIPHALEKQLPEYQYNTYTTETAKRLAMVISAVPGIRELRTQDGTFQAGAAKAVTSPVLIENYIRGWTGTLGQFALKAADYGLRQAGVVPSPERAEGTLADIPIVRAFVARYPSMGAQPIQDFYDNAQRTEKFFNTWKALAEKGDTDAMARIQEMGGPSMFARMEGVKKALGVVGRTIQMVNENPEIKPGEKRQLIDGMYYSMIQMARDGRAVQRQIQEAQQ